jgi:carbon storage regulator
MLVLSRKARDRILIGDGIEVAILSVQGSRVRLGIQAPPETLVLRAELTLEGREAPDSTAASGQA